MTRHRTDIAIVGAGIAGVSLAAALAPHARVALIEAEAHPAMHSTGRSAAFFAETYGGPVVQPLTTASKPFFLNPPSEFADVPLVTPRGALHVADDDGAALRRLAETFAGSPVVVDVLGEAQTRARCPLLAADWNRRALWEPECRDIDVAALHQGYLRMAKRDGARMFTEAPLLTAAREAERWRLQAGTSAIEAEIVVNAAGAWADPVALLLGAKPLGIQPFRRNMVVAETDRTFASDSPLVVDAGGGLYFKPEGDRLWISPHDEIPADPGDARPEDIDIAIAIDRFERATTAKVMRVTHSWAGLRSFAPDRLPVYGYDENVPNLFWCAGQGGFGIQTAPAAAEMAAAGVLKRRSVNIDPQPYAATRFS
ncbi:MAG: FAD-binding oxidoreductase [Pacificimonas sp.]